MTEDKLTKDDLVLLMESYRNMIVMHQSILEQSSKTIERLDNIATKQDNLFNKQNSVCTSLNNIGGNVDGLTTKVVDMERTVNNHEKKSIEVHGKIINKIHLGWIGMITIILGLIGLTTTMVHIMNNVPK